MLEKIGKGKYKWKTDESKGFAYSKNETAFILGQMDHKLDALDWDKLTEEEADNIAWKARELTETLIEIIEKQSK